MTKSSGLGQFLLVGGVDLSGDVGSLSNVHGGPTPLDVTAINKSAMERIGGVLDGGLDFQSWFNDAVGAAHPTLSALPTTDVIVLYGMSSTAGAPAAGLVAKSLDYGGTRGTDGSLSFSVPNVANGYSLEWCDLLTAGLRTDTSGTNGASLDNGEATTTGWSAYLAVTELTGTDVTVTLEDSADNSAWSSVTSGAFVAVSGVPNAQRIEGAAGATLRQYIRAVSSGTFTSATFAVAVCRHPVGATA